MSQTEMSMRVADRKETQSVQTRYSEARLRRPVRNQVEMILRDLDSLVPEDHPVRGIWDFLQRLDLSGFYSSIRAVLFYLAFNMALIHDQFVRLFNASLLDAMHASPFSA